MAEREHTVVVSRKAEIRRQTDALQDLFTLPVIARVLREMIDEPGTSTDEIARLVARDPALSANFLRLVNSPFYGFPGRIVCVHHALTLAGFNVVKAASSNITVCNTPGKHVVGLWEHSLGVALASRLLAQRLKVSDHEEVMVAGLLHDIGKVLLHTLFAEEAERVCRVAAERQIPTIEAEREILDVDHAEIGLWVAERWNFPATLKDPIAYHHDPARSQDRAAKTAIVHLADILVHALSFGCLGDRVVPELQHSAWNTLQLSVGNLEEIVEEVDNELSVTETALYRST